MQGCSATGCKNCTLDLLVMSGLAIFAHNGHLLCERHSIGEPAGAVRVWDPQRHMSCFRTAKDAMSAIDLAVWDPSSNRSLLFPAALSAADAHARAGR